MKPALLLLFFYCGSSFLSSIQAQRKNNNINSANPVLVDNGVLKWRNTSKEVALFGVNYTAPFAFAYRAIANTGVKHEDAIRQDVYHFARLGFDAFRVHVWDTEITDKAGNLLSNEHLQLFDFLIAELKKYNIKTIITPIAFWGNGYPEPDENTAGFSHYFGKRGCTTNDTAIRAQEKYLQQFFTHRNPYTGLTYQQDEDIIATEINNEPTHSGHPDSVTLYINRLFAAIRNSGWTKPIFYNISENPRYAKATVASNADGYSFQWYPSGLVSGKTLQANYLPHVSVYRIPFGDSIPAFLKKPRMVYEFDPADILTPVMYPAMAHSFRAAGFQWATQFAYDPMAIAHNNTEYQTHYLNLAYTPAKAISAMIAAAVFRHTNRSAAPFKYPGDSVFGPLRINYEQGVSQYITEKQFLYTGNTGTVPDNVAGLTQIAGTGNSAVVKYAGTGAYFLDKISAGIWRLEVMPDAIFTEDPYGKTTPQKTVATIVWQARKMQITLPDLGSGFLIQGLNDGNNTRLKAETDSFTIMPGTYMLQAAGSTNSALPAFAGILPMNHFAAPPPAAHADIYVYHQPLTHAYVGNSFKISATIAAPKDCKAWLLLSKTGWQRPAIIPMQEKSAYQWEATLPDEFSGPGLIQYRIMVSTESSRLTFPGKIPGDPLAWDYQPGASWEVVRLPENAALHLFKPLSDRQPLLYPSWQRGLQNQVVPTSDGSDFVWRYRNQNWQADSTMGIELPVKTKTASATGKFSIAIKATSLLTHPLRLNMVLIASSGYAWQAPLFLDTQTKEYVLDPHACTPASYLLLPRPYPGFHPLWFSPKGSMPVPELSCIERIQLIIKAADNPGATLSGVDLELHYIKLVR